MRPLLSRFAVIHASLTLEHKTWRAWLQGVAALKREKKRRALELKQRLEFEAARTM